MSDPMDLETWRKNVREWLAQHAEPRSAGNTADRHWGEGSDSVAVFHNLSHVDEAAILSANQRWQQAKDDAGYVGIDWPQHWGGAGLPAEYARAFAEEESAFVTPPPAELFSVTVRLIAPTVATFGTDDQKRRFLRPLRRAELLACQLFSEPGAGSDLAGLSCRAVRDGDDWVINGQKVWTSGAPHAAYGELIARTNPDAPKHKGLTVFLLPLDAPGVEIRPIRQMTGGASFSEVFFSDVRIPDDLRLGEVNDGWRVTLTTLGFERSHSGSSRRRPGGSWEQLVAAARHFGRSDDPVVRQALADVYIRATLLRLNAERVAAAARAGHAPGPEGSIGKLAWTESMRRMSEVATEVLGPRLAADTAEWGAYAWSEHVLGAPGYRIAGGSDEIQRNIIAERVLGLPRE
ncbi:MAG: acyl-CoA dehydrogenase family protein [Actinobacteria bacterium]|nr:acyl-CoA dehydrogenase family protein [Actinomycetota bacterium]